MRSSRRGDVLGNALPLVLLVALTAGCAAIPVGTAGRTTAEAGAHSPSQAPRLAPPKAVPDPLGVFWVPTPRTMPEPYLRQVAGGPTWNQAVWCMIEPRPDHRSWTGLDDAVRRARELGFTVMLKIRVGACWATGGPPGNQRGANGVTESRMPTSLAAYASFVRAVVARYAPLGVQEYAVENEPNALNWFWAGSVDQLVTLTRTAATAIHAADPVAQVVSWGVASEAYGYGVVDRLLAEHHPAQAISTYDTYFAHRPHPPYPRVTSETALRAFLADGSRQFALAVLRAEQQLLAEHVFDVRQVHFYESWRCVPALMSYLHATTPSGVPIEFWEAGQFWSGGGPPDQQVRAAQLTKTVALLLAEGATRVVWLPLTADPQMLGTDKEEYYGVLAPGGRPRQAADSFRRLVRWSADTSGAAVAVSGAQGVAFPHGSQTWLVTWRAQGGSTIARPPGTAEAWDLGGSRLSWSASGLHLGADPVFVKVGMPTSRAVELFSR